MNTLNEMWAALAAHKPAPEYAEAWQTMLREQTEAAAEVAAEAAAEVAEAAAEAAASAAWAAAVAAACAAAGATQRAINAIKEVQS